jgi:hypothetical protein
MKSRAVDRGRMDRPTLVGDLMERRVKCAPVLSEADVGEGENERTKEDEHTFEDDGNPVYFDL